MTTRKRSWLCVLIAGVATPAIAAHDWDCMTTRADGTLIAVAPATFSRTGDRATAVFRFRKGEEEWYNLVGADCRSGGVPAMRLTETGPALTRARHALPAGAAYHQAVQGSVGAWLVRAMCADPRMPTNVMPGPTGAGDPALIPH